MKKILIFAALAAGMASCTSEEPVQVSDSYAIGFSTYVGKATRAGDVNTESLNSFAVYGGTEAQEFKGTTVTKDNGAWVYSPVQYWKEGAKYNFAAVAPAVEGASYSAKKLTVANYTPGETDLIVAASNEITGAAAGSNQLVTLNFKHALAKVQFTFEGDAANVSDVKLTSVSNKANLEVSYSEGTAATWGESAGTGEYTYTLDANGKGVKYLLPQTIGDAVKVSYTYNEKVHTINVKTTEVAAWEMGKAYNYTVSLSSDAIGFEVVEAAEWTTTELKPTESTTEENSGDNSGNTNAETPATLTLETMGSTTIRSNNASYNSGGLADTMELKNFTKDGEENVSFYGLFAFDLPANIQKQGYKMDAKLRLVCVYKKGTRYIQLRELTGKEFKDNASFGEYGETVQNIINTGTPLAEFETNGWNGKAMKDANSTDSYKTVAEWTNYIDLTDFINTKTSVNDNGSTISFVLSKRDADTSDQALRMATKNTEDITNGVETFKAADLVPQLVITYTKE